MTYTAIKHAALVLATFILLFFSHNLSYALNCTGIWILKIEGQNTTISKLDETITINLTRSTSVLSCNGDNISWPLPSELNESPVEAFCTEQALDKEISNVTKIQIQCK